MLQSAFAELQKNQSATTRGELVTANASQYLTAYLDAGGSRDWGAGEPVYAYYWVTGAANLNPGTSLQFLIVGSDTVPNVNGTDGTNPVTLADSGAILTANLTANARGRIGVLKSGSLKRYLGCKLTEVGGAVSTGAVVVALSHNSALIASYGDTSNSLQ